MIGSVLLEVSLFGMPDFKPMCASIRLATFPYQGWAQQLESMLRDQNRGNVGNYLHGDSDIPYLHG